MSVTLLEFPKPADITDQLRNLANDIDSGAYGDVEAVAFALHGSDGLWANGPVLCARASGDGG